MKTPKITEIELVDSFEDKEDFVRWIFKNREQLEVLINTKLSNKLGDYIAGVEEIRPDLYFVEEKGFDKIAILVNFNSSTEKDFNKLLAMAAFRDLQQVVWVAENLSPKTVRTIYWLNEKLGYKIRFLPVKISVYEVEGFGNIPHLSRWEMPEFIDKYQLY